MVCCNRTRSTSQCYRGCLFCFFPSQTAQNTFRFHHDTPSSNQAIHSLVAHAARDEQRSKKKRGELGIWGEALLFISSGLFLARAAVLASRLFRAQHWQLFQSPAGHTAGEDPGIHASTIPTPVDWRHRGLLQMAALLSLASLIRGV